MIEQIKKLIAGGENQHVEFKKAKKDFPNEYTGYEPIIEDESTFKFILKHDFFNQKSDSDQVTHQVSDQVNDQVSDQDDLKNNILEFCIEPKSLSEILSHCGYKSRIHFKNKILNPLIKNGDLSLTVPDKPTSKNQKYVAVKKRLKNDWHKL